MADAMRLGLLLFIWLGIPLSLSLVCKVQAYRCRQHIGGK